MVKYTQTIRRLLPTNCLSVFDHFVGLPLKGLKWLEKSLDRKFFVLRLRVIGSVEDTPCANSYQFPPGYI